jgi:RNA polymerase sigma-70 factor (ECF subfamily)
MKGFTRDKKEGEPPLFELELPLSLAREIRFGQKYRLATEGPDLSPVFAEKTEAMAESDLDLRKRWRPWECVLPRQFLGYYDRYHEPLTRFIFHKTLDSQLAQELTSQTFLRASQDLWKFRWQGVTFGVWLYRLAIAEVADHVRRQRKPGPRPLGDSAGWSGPRLKLLVRAGLKRWQRRVFECLGKIPDSCRDLLVLYYWEDFNLSQVGAILRLREGAVAGRLDKCLQQLHSLVKSDGTEPPDIVA